MALGSGHGSESANEELGLGFVPLTRLLGRKRVLVSSDTEPSSPSLVLRTPWKKACYKMVDENGELVEEKSTLEEMPQDILIRILCGVDHDDLKQLFHVSSRIRDATLIARKLHFAYSTPSKLLKFRSPFDAEEPDNCEDLKTPDAPKQLKCSRSLLRGRRFSGLAVALFSSYEE